MPEDRVVCERIIQGRTCCKGVVTCFRPFFHRLFLQRRGVFDMPRRMISIVYSAEQTVKG